MVYIPQVTIDLSLLPQFLNPSAKKMELFVSNLLHTTSVLNEKQNVLCSLLRWNENRNRKYPDCTLLRWNENRN